MSNEEKSETLENVRQNAQERAIILEFENIIIESRAAMFAILKENLSAYDKELTVPLFSRFCVYDRPESFIPQVSEELGVNQRSYDKLIKEFNEGMDAYWKSSDKDCRPGVAAFLAETGKQGFAHIAVTALPEKLVGQVVQGLGEAVDSLEIHSFSDQNKLLPGADVWMQAAIDRGIDPGVCMGLSSSSKSCWSALSADLHCIGVPDPFTAYQDFGGASRVYHSLEEADVKELISTFYDSSSN